MNENKFIKKQKKFEKLYGEPIIWFDKKRSLFGLPLTFTTYILTETRLITKTGFLQISEDEIDLYKVMDKKVNFSLFERLFKCGTIILTSTDLDAPTKILKSIKEPRKVKKLLDKNISLQQDKYNIRGRDMIGAANNIDDM